MQLESLYRFERDSAKAMLAAERDQKKKRVLAERVAHYERELRRLQQGERGADE